MNTSFTEVLNMFPGAIIFLVVFTILILIVWDIASKTLKTVDKRISEFNNTNFLSLEEKDRARQQLKAELISLKNRAIFIKIIWYKINDRIMSL